MGFAAETRIKKGCGHMARAFRRDWPVALMAIVTALVLSTSASASSSLNLRGPFAVFDYCPLAKLPLVPGGGIRGKCLYVVTKGGSVTLGKKTVPIVNPVTFQGAYGPANEEEGGETIGGITYNQIAQYFEPTNGRSLSKTPEPVPGGLLGLVPPASSPPAIRALTALYNEKNASSVAATVEPAGEIFISEYDLVSGEGVAQRMPIKIHLENSFLGSSCYIGSNSSPILWNLTTGTTAPPAPNKPIAGSTGGLHIEDDTRVPTILGTELVDNAWSAPAATGCGGVLAPIVDPLIDASTGLPSPAGRNTVTLSELYISPTAASSVVEAVKEAAAG
jgi:hypothetical protein